MSPRAVVVSVFLLTLLHLTVPPIPAGPATAPYVKGELLVAFQEPPAGEVFDQTITYGSLETIRASQD